MAKIFLSVADVTGTVSDSNSFVYGHNKNNLQNVTVTAGVSNIVMDANVDQLTLTGNSKDYQFFQAGNALKIVQNGVVVTDVYIQDDIDGTQLNFKDKAISAKFGSSAAELYLSVGGQIVNQPLSNDSTSPKIVSFSPLDNNTNVAANTNITLTFDEPIKVSSGYIVLNGTDTKLIDVKDKTQVTVSNNTLVINPTADLKQNSFYSVQIAEGVIQDLAGNNFAGILDTTTFNFKTTGLVLTGKAIDGYLKDATVVTTGSDGKTYTVKTDANGNFSFEGKIPSGIQLGVLTTTGGIDLSTGKEFKGVLKAPAGSTMITPLTTLQHSLMEEKGLTVEKAQEILSSALDFDNSVDLQHYDPIDAMTNSSVANKEVAADLMATTVKIANLLVVASETLKGAAGTSITTEESAAALTKSLVNAISTKNVANVKIDLADTVLLKNVLLDSAKEVAATVAGASANLQTSISSVADKFAADMKTAADNITTAVKTGDDSKTLLASLGAVSSTTQSDVSSALQSAASEAAVVSDNANTSTTNTNTTTTNTSTNTSTDSTSSNTSGSSSSTPPPPPVPALTLSVDKATANEGDAITYTVTSTIAAPTGGFSVPYTLSGTGISTTDFIDIAALTGTVNIAAGATTGTFILNVANDGATESVENLLVTLGTTTGATLAVATKTTAIADPALTLSVDKATANEGDAITYTVTSTVAAPAGGFSVPYTLSGTGISAADFKNLANLTGTINILEGATTGTLTLTVANDVATESVENLLVTLGTTTGATLAVSTGETAITDVPAAAISGAGTTTATENNDIFVVNAGGYTHTIAGFAAGDKLRFSFTASLNIVRDTDQTDGIQHFTASDPESGATTTIILTGLTPTQDDALFNIPSINTVFGSGTIA